MNVLQDVRTYDLFYFIYASFIFVFFFLMLHNIVQCQDNFYSSVYILLLKSYEI